MGRNLLPFSFDDSGHNKKDCLAIVDPYELVGRTFLMDPQKMMGNASALTSSTLSKIISQRYASCMITISFASLSMMISMRKSSLIMSWCTSYRRMRKMMPSSGFLSGSSDTRATTSLWSWLQGF
jgi:hypothetical protein